MSHFTVMVIGPDPEAQLAPYHEFESTGNDNEYVVDVDETEKYRAEYAETTETHFRGPDGTLLSKRDDIFYREPTPEEVKAAGPLGLIGDGFGGGLSYRSRDWGDGRGHRAKVHFIPDGWTEVEVPVTTRSFQDWLSDWTGSKILRLDRQPDLKGDHKYGFIRVSSDGEVTVIRRTNPQKKWDWYSLGGRWTGALKLLPQKPGQTGKPGLMTEEAAPGFADKAFKGDVDWDGMRLDAEIKARFAWKTAREITGGKTWDSWDDVRTRFKDDRETARDFYHGQSAIVALRTSGNKQFGWDLDDDLTLDQDIYVQRRRDAACVQFAFVRDSQWTERGSMGWFGAVSDEISKSQWNRRFNEMLDALPDDTLISIYDCHI